MPPDIVCQPSKKRLSLLRKNDFGLYKILMRCLYLLVVCPELVGARLAVLRQLEAHSFRAAELRFNHCPGSTKAAQFLRYPQYS
jgi:hypothetical protein